MATVVRPVITAVGGLDSIVSGLIGDNLIVGTAPINSRVSIYFGTTLLGTATAGSSGAISYALTAGNLTTLGQGTGKSITAKAVDAAGNVSTASAAKTFAVQSVAPGAPKITSVGGSDGIVSSQSNDNLVVGTAVSGTTVTIYSGTTALGTAVATNGAFSYALTAGNLTTLGQGTGKSITAKAVDVAGNVSTASAAKTFAVQSVAPGAPKITSVGGSDGIVSSQSNDNLVVGTAVTGTTVTIYRGTTALGTAVATNGAFSYALTTANLTTLGQGTGKTITAKAADTAGNVSAASVAKTFAVQSIAPAISDTSLLKFPALAMINYQADMTYYGLYSGEGNPSRFSQQYKGINSSLKFNGSSYTGSYKDTDIHDAQTYTTSVTVTGEYTPSLFSALVRSSPDGLPNKAYSDSNYFTIDESTYTSLTQSSPSAWASYFGFSNLIDSNENLKPLSSPVKFIRGYNSDYSGGTFNGSWDAIHQLTLGTSSPTSPWFSCNLWLIQGTFTDKDSLGTINSQGEFSNLFTNQGIVIAENIESQGPSCIMYSTTDTSIFNSLDSRASGAIAATPKSLFYLGTNQPDELTGTSANEVFIPLGGNDTVTMGGGKDLLVLASITGNPSVTDFIVGDDKIFLSNKTYTTLAQTAGGLNANNFVIGSPKDSNDYIFYNQATGGLFYDADGNGKGVAIQIATFGTDTHPILTASNFIIG